MGVQGYRMYVILSVSLCVTPCLEERTSADTQALSLSLSLFLCWKKALVFVLCAQSPFPPFPLFCFLKCRNLPTCECISWLQMRRLVCVLSCLINYLPNYAPAFLGHVQSIVTMWVACSSMCQGLAAIKQSSTSTKPQPTHIHGPIMNLSSSSSGRQDTRVEEDAYTINHLAELLHGDEVIIRRILTNMVLAQGISHISAPSVNLAFSWQSSTVSWTRVS